MAEKDYIATEALFVGTARAHNRGDVVPAANVKRNGWQDSVAHVGTKAANEAQGVSDDVVPAVPEPAPPVPAKTVK